MNRPVLIGAALAILLAAAAWFAFFNGRTKEWVAEDQDDFMRACLETSGGAMPYCSCALEITMDAYDTLEEASADFAARDPADIPAAQHALAKCQESAAPQEG